MSRVTVLITTRNRRAEVGRAISSALLQTCRPEVVVIDDASTDGTAKLVEHAFPEVAFHRSPEPKGYIVQRNRGMRLAQSPIVVLLDDDAVLQSSRTLEQTLDDFDDPRIGAVAIPHVDVAYETTPRLSSPPDALLVTSEFTGTAAAIRRDAFEAVGGFRESFVHQTEERDFCLRLLDAGWVVRVGRADPIHHYCSPARDVRRMDLYGRRNVILCAWYNEPLPSALVRIAEMSAVGLWSGLRVRRPVNALHGLWLGYRACWAERRHRRPVARPVNRAFRRLWKRGPLPLSSVEGALSGAERSAPGRRRVSIAADRTR
ncbi:MAG TPA: glycosyltransferase [Gaiellaceae bacterium]|nr:glycosyltransferase [Gaiellaceae bacterium]